jgi:hypothetical protein
MSFSCQHAADKRVCEIPATSSTEAFHAQIRGPDLSVVHIPGQLRGSEAGSCLTVFEFSRDDKKTCVSTADTTETLRKLKGRCCKVLVSEVFLLGAKDHDALVKTKTKVMQVTIGPGDVWTESYENCKNFTVAQILNGLGSEERRQMPIQLKFTMVDIAQKSATEILYDSDSGEGV